MGIAMTTINRLLWNFGPSTIACLCLAACGGGSDTQTDEVATNSEPQVQVATAMSVTVGGSTIKSSAAEMPFRTITKSGKFSCQPLAITCVEITSTSTSLQANAPITFGQAFKPGDLKSGQTLIAMDRNGSSVPLQMDAISTRNDDEKSVRMAVLSLQLSNLAVGERRVVSFFSSNSVAPAAVVPDAANYSLDLTARMYQPQLSLITFGNRNGQSFGIPFLKGEQINLKLTGGKGTETYTLTVTDALAGGGWPTLTKIAEAFKAQINANTSSAFVAIKQGEGGGYEKLWITSKFGDGGAFTPTIEYAGLSPVKTQQLSAYAAPVTYSVSAGDALRSAVAAGATNHLHGRIANEYTLSLPFSDANGAPHPQLTARLHVRLLDGGTRSRTDMVIENNWAYKAKPGNLNYELTVTSAGKHVFSQPMFKHNHHARWHKVLWQGDEVQAVVRHEMPYLMKTGVIWNYNQNLTIPESVLAAEGTRLVKTYTGPMSSVYITPYFGTTGGREEIGPYPRWTALYLLSQDDRMRMAMLANADAAGSVPIHYRDEATDHPLDLHRHPGVAIGAGKSDAKDALPAMGDSVTIWSPDLAHQGSFAFVPYLLTGDVYYLDETMFWASYNMAVQNPAYRGRELGLIHTDQVRGQAWALRSIGEAARAAPDLHPMKGYFEKQLANNLNNYSAIYNASNPKISQLGAIEKPDAVGQSGPWQQDFMVIVLAQLTTDGYADLAQPTLDWLTKFAVGRFAHESDANFCTAKAPTAYMAIRDTKNGLIANWSDLYQRNWPGEKCTATMPIVSVAYPDSVSAYAAYARAMMAAVFNAGKTPTLPIYQSWVAKTPRITDKGYASDPTWAIVPKAN
jgi:hypothetical protein